MPTTVDELQTPCLLLEQERMKRNLARLRDRMVGFGVALRPHLKTCKSVEVARLMMPTPQGPATVSTLREAEEFAAAGVRDLTYAVGIAPQKLERVAALRAQGADLSVVLDSREQAEAVAARSRAGGGPIPALIEIDADGHRAGVRPADREQLLAIGKLLGNGGAELRGVLTHAGASYNARNSTELEAAAEQERAAVVDAATTLRAAGFPCPVVSVGSTPTAHFARNLSGVTEVRAGVYVFFDLTMVGLGVCDLGDIAISVLATVIGHQTRGAERLTLTDAGWMALSRDRSTASQQVDQGYGLVCDLAGRRLGDGGLVVAETSQEHGVLAARPASRATMPTLPLGTRVRILPNHACATAAQFDRYHVLDGGQTVLANWPRFGGW